MTDPIAANGMLTKTCNAARHDSRHLHNKQKDAKHRERPENKKSEIGLLLCLKLAAIFDVIVARKCSQTILDRDCEFLNVRDHTRQIPTVDVAEDHDSPLHVLAIQRVWPRRIENIDHLAE